MSTYRQTAPITLYTVQCTPVHKKKSSGTYSTYEP